MRMSDRRFLGLVVVFVVALTITYWNHFDNGFHFDDSHTIVNNSSITDIKNIPQFFVDAKTTSSLPTNQAYRPVITTLNTIDHWIAGELNVKVFHWHIYLEFLVLLGFLFFLFRRIFMACGLKYFDAAALIGIMFFAFHTATAETINYVISRSDGFSTLMVVISMLMHISTTGWKKHLALLPFIAGCFAKPTTLMLAPILLMYHLIIEDGSILIKSENKGFVAKVLDAISKTWLYFVLGIGLFWFTRSMFSDTWSPSNISAVHYLNTQPYIFWVYVKTFFLPTGLTADTDLGLIKEILSGKVLYGILILLITVLVGLWAATKRKTLPIAFGIGWFITALVPSSSVVPLAEVMNHHRTFFPYIGLIMATIAAAFLVYDEAIKRSQNSKLITSVSVIIAVLILGGHAYGTHLRNEVWHDDTTLWHDVTIKSPKNGRGLMNYGLTRMRIGELEEAIDYFERARSTGYGQHPYLFLNLGIAKDALGNRLKEQSLKSEGEQHLKYAVQVGPGYPDCHYYYAKWNSENGNPNLAIHHLNKALQLSPSHQSAAILLQAISGNAQAALANAETNAANANTPEAYLELSLVYYNAGRYEDCIAACNDALVLKPNYAEAYNNICSAYNKLGKYAEAITSCKKALEIAPGYKLAAGNLNWAEKQLSAQ